MVIVGATERIDGDMHPDGPHGNLLCRRQHALLRTSWSMLDQQHGVEVHTLERGRARLVARCGHR